MGSNLGLSLNFPFPGHVLSVCASTSPPVQWGTVPTSWGCCEANSGRPLKGMKVFATIKNLLCTRYVFDIQHFMYFACSTQ